MITEEPDNWGTPSQDILRAILSGQPTLVKARTPSGTVIEMPRREFDSKVAIGLSLTEVEDE